MKVKENKAVSIEGSVFRADGQPLSEIQFSNAFLAWLESKGYQFLGVTKEEDEE